MAKKDETKKQSKNYEPLNEVEKILIYEFLERIQNDAHFKQAVIENPEVALASASPNLTYAKLLRPNLLQVMGDLRRVALEEIGIDVAPFRDSVSDNGFKLAYDNKE
ncbi:MAG: hypothetical protein VX787_16105 [Pseudomonadota bacterium]|nr:hypothetical protein [Pseudomonadota bacterium]|tara:strand:- start:4336 stop:4656 length:321 start_codon:yes stop_codon:yes gene_type:complete